MHTVGPYPGPPSGPPAPFIYRRHVGRFVAVATQFAMFIGVLFGLLPAMGLLYFMLHRYEGFFEDKRIFLFLVFGMVMGGFVTAIEIVMGFHRQDFLQATTFSVAFPLLVGFYPLLESAAKTVVLNWGTVRSRKDTPYYAIPLGLGFGAVATFILIARGVVQQAASPGFAELTHGQIALFYFLLLELFVGGIMIHAFVAAVISIATMHGQPFRGVMSGALLMSPFYVGYYLVYAPTQGAWTLIVPTFVLGYGIWSVRYTVTKILDQVVPPEMARKVRREIRRKALEES